MSTNTNPCQPWPEPGRGKDALLGKHKALSTFPRHDDDEIKEGFLYRGLLRTTKDETTVERRAGKPDCAIGRH